MASMSLLLYIYVTLYVARHNIICSPLANSCSRRRHRTIKMLARRTAPAFVFYGILTVHWTLSLRSTSDFLWAAP
jgi:hypothetical protein